MAKKDKLYKISELEKLSGLPRRTIHFYIQSGLLHPPLKTGKTMSYYDDGHLQKLMLIQREKSSGSTLFAIKRGLSQGKEISAIQGAHRISFKLNLLDAKKNPKRRTGPRKKLVNRNNIIRQGCILFRQKGYAQTKVSDITKALNIGKGTFYFYFSDKRELLLECVPMIFQELFSQGWDIIRNEKNPLKRLELRAQTVFPVMSEFCSIVALCKEAMEDTDSKLKRMGKEIFLSIRKPLETDIENGIEKGFLKPVDPKIIGTIMIGMIESMYYLKDLDQTLSHEAVWKNIISLLISGMKK
ncbi:MAG: TetR family transcriptional regulator [Desulfobacterales bacterium]|jgi:AcrR family transcriptional regulator|nr:TetR family transcriptional regulator [Desulfobacterales bacterium]